MITKYEHNELTQSASFICYRHMLQCQQHYNMKIQLLLINKVLFNEQSLIA